LHTLYDDFFGHNIFLIDEKMPFFDERRLGVGWPTGSMFCVCGGPEAVAAGDGRLFLTAIDRSEETD
jgi:hypothetical protein